VRGLGDRAHRETEEEPVLVAVEGGDRLQAELLQRDVRELRSLARAIEGDPLQPLAVEVAERLTEGLARPAVDPEGVAHVVVGEPGLFEQALGRQDVAQALPGVGFRGNSVILIRPSWPGV